MAAVPGRVEQIEQCLRQAFEPSYLSVDDNSHLHAGHAGAKDGRGHFHVTVVSNRFAGKHQLARHRMVYASLRELLQTDVHALGIEAYTDDDFNTA